jgi:hypothetical protein
MRRQLSARLTILAKIIMPGLWIFVWSLTTLMMFIGLDERTQSPGFLFFGVGFASIVILYFTVMKYMKVAIDDRFLYVSNYLKEVSIPLSNIQDVTEIIWLRGHPVTIHLKTPSEFGSKITFMPMSQGFKFFQPHPVVGELKELAKINVSAGFRQ